jgi:citrate lyase subunit beta/citryl-CoA lyase
MSRSYLFIPGNTPSMIQNLDVFESDSVIIDFEDSVMAYDKDAARILVANFLSKYQFDKTDIYLRINSEDSEYFLEDVLVTTDLAIKGYVLPKALPESIDKLKELTDKSIIPIIESPMAFLKAEEIASKDGVTGILLGAEDFTKEMGINRSVMGTEILYVRSRLAIICNAYGIESIDTPFTMKDNEEGLELDCNNAKNLGFTSKSSIHPNHVDMINQVFAPNQDEINQSLRIIKKSETETKGAFSLDGKMIDAPIIEKAKRVIEKAKKYNLL